MTTLRGDLRWRDEYFLKVEPLEASSQRGFGEGVRLPCTVCLLVESSAHRLNIELCLHLDVLSSFLCCIELKLQEAGYQVPAKLPAIFHWCSTEGQILILIRAFHSFMLQPVRARPFASSAAACRCAKHLSAPKAASPPSTK